MSNNTIMEEDLRIEKMMLNTLYAQNQITFEELSNALNLLRINHEKNEECMLNQAG